MNMRVPAPFATAAHGKRKFNPRREILDEVVAGIFWMSLDLPEDASMSEMEEFASHLVRRVRSGAGTSAIEAEIDFLQRRQFCRAPDAAIIGELARRTVALVTAA